MMLNDSRAYIQTEPRLMLFPGMVILLAVLGFNLLGKACAAQRVITIPGR